MEGELTAGTIVGIFFEQARNRGERPMTHRWAQGGWQAVSWSEAARSVERIGGALVGLGVEPGEAVLLISENRVEWILADLGIQAAGGVTVPVYPTSTPDSIAKISANCGARLAISGSPELVAKLPKDVTVMAVDDDLAGWMESGPPAEASAELKRRLAALKPSDVATIIYTSGTTGDPKGVVLPHSNFVEMARSSLEVFPVGSEDVMISFLPFSHVFERQSGLVVGLLAGGQGFISRGLDRLAEDIASVNPTVLLGVPRMFEKIVDRIQAEVARQPRWKRWLFNSAVAGRLGPLGGVILKPVRQRIGGTRLRMFVSGGAPLAESVESFFWRLGIPIYNGWGMTETTSGAIANSPGSHRYGTVGKAMPGVEIRFDEDGELLVKSPGVMRGYSQNQEATDEVLEDGWLRTGDIAEVDSDGFVRITDRKKDLMKTSDGKFVAPQPIESALQATAMVETAVLVGEGRPYVTALIVPKWDNVLGDLGLAGNPPEMVDEPRVMAAVQGAVDSVNAKLAHWETVKYFRLLPRDFEESEGERTPSLKIKRKTIRENYSDLIDAMYAEGARNRPA
ncbi:MAG TPA: long-chain fatty acid--CoA ligase [Candidatus Dormibacteraeota bacterium]|nr:long-chain fatty acid--CoA ligase [Candidatus Dormibacteraeota bacterium]